MEELSCPRCRMTKYRNPSLRLMINICGHALCEACVDLLFVRESGSCPECGMPLRRSGFRTQLFEDTTVDKEVDVRKQMMKIFNKQESDFDSLKNYNDYLEEVENIIDSLVTGVNAEETRARIAAYKTENKTLIRRNQARLNQEREYVQEQIEKEKRQSDLRRQIQDDMEKEKNAAKRQKQLNLIDELENNKHLTPQEVLELHRQKLLNGGTSKTLEERMVTGVEEMANITNTSYSSNFKEFPVKLQNANQYKYVQFEENILGPNLPDKNHMIESGYLKHVRESSLRDTGGGYSSLLACSRALQEAFTGLLWHPMSTVADIR